MQRGADSPPGRSPPPPQPPHRGAHVLSVLRDVLRVELGATALALAGTAVALYVWGWWATAVMVSFAAAVTTLPLLRRFPTLAVLARLPIAAGAAGAAAAVGTATILAATVGWATILAEELGHDVAAAAATAITIGTSASGATTAVPIGWLRDVEAASAAVDQAGRSLWANAGAYPSELATLVCSVEIATGCRGWRTGDCQRRGRPGVGADGGGALSTHPCPTRCESTLRQHSRLPFVKDFRPLQRKAFATGRDAISAPTDGSIGQSKDHHAVISASRQTTSALPPLLHPPPATALAMSAVPADGCWDLALCFMAEPPVSLQKQYLWAVVAAGAAFTSTAGMLTLVLCVKLN